jgi:ABC-2 type transport system ATP-binding protein
LRPPQLTSTLHDLTGWAIEHGADLESIQIVRPSLEDVYLSLVGDVPGAP